MDKKTKIESLRMNRTFQIIVGFMLYLVSIITLVLFFPVQSKLRYFSVLAIFTLGYLALIFLPQRLVKYFVKNKQDNNAKYHLTKLVIILLLICLPVISLICYSSYSNKLLKESNLYSKALIQNIQWVSNKHGGEFRVFYFYSIGNKVYYHNAKNTFWKVGDTILVKYCASNPDNHEIVMK